MNPQGTSHESPQVSVVVATYNRASLLLSLLNDLSSQDFDSFEVVLVDDGSASPARAILAGISFPYALRLIEQQNAGQAIARDNGIRHALGEIVIIIDDDMRLPPHFVSEHVAQHRAGHTLVLGHIRSSPELGGMPLFERFHARQLDAFVATVARGETVRGAKLCTGNVSFRRTDYEKIGGFDRSLSRSEDRDLGIRLEHGGARIVFSERAYTTHASDHTNLATWLRRARLYGRCDSVIADKHAALEYVDPWRFIFDVNPVSRPILMLVTVLPSLGRPIARSAMSVSQVVDRFGLDALAISGTTLAYGVEYFVGMREYAGSLRGSLGGFSRYLKKRRSAR